jgi:hypothetical protein
MLAYIREKTKNAKIYLKENWAYETDSLHPKFGRYGRSQKEMYEALKKAYAEAAKANDIPLIPCGDVIQALRTKEPFLYGHGGMSICRDGFHMNVIYGRYLLAAVWYKTLTGRSLKNNSFVPSTKLAPNAVCDEAVLSVVRETADEIA